jgi:two-component system, NtrC family, sensor kinase
MSTEPRLRTELLGSLAVLLASATLIAGLALNFVMPRIGSASDAALFVFVLLGAEFVVVLILGEWILRRSVLKPVEMLARDVQRIADGDYAHRVEPPLLWELRRIMEGVNTLADGLIRDQKSLARNVESLEETNRQLIEARDQVVQAARLASVGTLAAGLAHEVGNPLGAIIGFTDVAIQRARAEGEDTEVLEGIREEAQRIDRIVRGLLDYARPKKDEFRPVRPAEAISSVRGLLETQGKLTTVGDEWELDESAPEVLIDEQHLEQVLVNLLLNAVHALEGAEDPRLTVRLTCEEGPGALLPVRREGDHPSTNYRHRRRVALDEEAEAIATLRTAERVVVIDVVDTGPGLSPDVLENIFDPFFTTKDPGMGTGLGLFIASRLVEGMGGRIEARNGEDGGAIFTLRFPEAVTISEATEEQP